MSTTVPAADRRVPRRVRHSEGGGALGFFEATGDVTALTRAALFQPGARTDVVVRFSRTLGFRGGPDSWRDVRGFAVKFFTDDGEYDLVGNNSPVFFLRDDAKFASMVVAQNLKSPSPLYDYDRLWDFYTRTPETAHQVAWLLSDRGIPASWRHQDGFGVHTFAWIDAEGARVWVRYHLRTDQGHRTLSDDEAAAVPGDEADYFRDDLRAAIDRGDPPSWTLAVQVMSDRHVRASSFDPFDATKVWPKGDHPLQVVGRLVLDRNAEDEHEQVEAATFSPSNLVPGIGPSPDPLLRARSVGYPTFAQHRGGRRAAPALAEWPAAPRAWAPDDFGQAGDLVRNVLDDAGRARLAATIARHVEPIVDPRIVQRVLRYWRNVDVGLAERVARALSRRGGE